MGDVGERRRPRAFARGPGPAHVGRLTGGHSDWTFGHVDQVVGIESTQTEGQTPEV